MNYPLFISFFVEIALAGGLVREGIEWADEALRCVASNLDCYYEPELLRLKGELKLLEGQGEAALTCFNTALDLARSQQAKSLELRAAMSLARLWQSQGKQAEAHELLAPIYAWFTEGLDTRDLKDAKALLDELS